MPNRSDREPTPAMEAAAPAPLDDRSARLLAALVELGQATAGGLAEHTGIGYSTTTPKLRRLNKYGLAEPVRDDNGPAVWRPTGAGSVHHAATRAEGENAAGGAGRPTGRQKAGPDPAAGTDTRNDPPPPPATDADGTPEVDAVPDGGATPAAEGRSETVRRAPGSLGRAVMVILRAHPHVAFKVGELSKLINQAEAGTGMPPASPGAVVLACQRRVNAGEAILAAEKPASFQLLPGTAAEPAPITGPASADVTRAG